MSLLSWFKKLFDRSDDPVRHCRYYRDYGCAHIDGPECDMGSCTILACYAAKDPIYTHADYEAVPHSNALSNGLVLLQCFPHYAYGNHPTETGNWLHRLEDGVWVPVRPLMIWESLQAEDQNAAGLVLLPKSLKG